MNAVANTGVIRFRIGMETMQATTMPYRKTRSAFCLRSARASATGRKRIARKLEIFPAEEIGVGEEEHAEIDAGMMRSASATMLTKSTSPKKRSESSVEVVIGSALPGASFGKLRRSTCSAISSKKSEATSDVIGGTR